MPKLLILDFVSSLDKESLKSHTTSAHLRTWVLNRISKTFTVTKAISGALASFYVKCSWDKLHKKTSHTPKCPTTSWMGKSTLHKIKTSGKYSSAASRETSRKELIREPCFKMSPKPFKKLPFCKTSSLDFLTVTAITPGTYQWSRQIHFISVSWQNNKLWTWSFRLTKRNSQQFHHPKWTNLTKNRPNSFHLSNNKQFWKMEVAKNKVWPLRTCFSKYNLWNLRIQLRCRKD